MRKIVTGMMLCASLATASTAWADHAEDVAKQGKKLTEATSVYTELVSSADRGVPKELQEHCKCVAVVPSVLKAALGVGARHGSGVMACRNASGWSSPAFINISGGSVGMQAGAESTDLVLFFMNDRGARSLVNGTHITLGGNASVAAGPFGRSGEAATNLELKAEIYSYARSKGLFAGLALEGAHLGTNAEDITNYYGAGTTYKQVLFGSGPTSVKAEAETFRKTLP
jgi:lipid-binding SYLF domain-containing protein